MDKSISLNEKEILTRDKRAEMLFDFCYSQLCTPNSDTLMSQKTTKNRKSSFPSKIFGELKLAPSTEESEEYWKHHNKNYLNRIEKLAEKLSLSIDGKTQGIILIPVMNEFDLKKVIEAIRNSTNIDASNLPIVILNNYKGEKPSNDSISAIDEVVKQNKNIHILGTQVPDFSTVALAKKILTDIILLKIGLNNIPLILVDADVTDLSDGLIEKCAEYIYPVSVMKLAASPNLNIDESTLQKNKYFAFFNRVKTKMIEMSSREKGYKKSTIGPFTYIGSSTLLKVGGLKPALLSKDGFILVDFEDMQLTKDLNMVTASETYKQYPVSNIGLLSMTVKVDGKKELDAYEKGLPDQWSNVTYYQDISGVRPKTIGSEIGGLELLNVVINKYWETMVISLGSNGDLQGSKYSNEKSKEILESLNIVGCRYEVEAIDLMNMQGLPASLILSSISKKDENIVKGDKAKEMIAQSSSTIILSIKILSLS